MNTRSAQHPTSEQLSLLPVSELPVQFRLDQRTRQRGLAHIAAIRRQLAAKSPTSRVTDTKADERDFADHGHQAA